MNLVYRSLSADRTMQSGPPFPPSHLMERTSGLTSASDFEDHGRTIFRALELASPFPLNSYGALLDFGVGCGRLARMFSRFPGSYVGLDIDRELADWCAANLPWVTPVISAPRQRIPLARMQFDCVISVSVFTHINAIDTEFYLSELKRLTKPGAMLFLTVHGHRALQRAASEIRIRDMLTLSPSTVDAGQAAMRDDGFYFVPLASHLATDAYDYGTTFVAEQTIKEQWSKHFDVIEVRSGAIHDFQDIVVLRHPLRAR